MRKTLKAIILMIFVAFFVLVVALNSSQSINFNLIFYHFDAVPLGLALAVAFGLGFVISLPLLITSSISNYWHTHEKVAKVRAKAQHDIETIKTKVSHKTQKGEDKGTKHSKVPPAPPNEVNKDQKFKPNNLLLEDNE
jgi:uncharacterized integral membrane protein